MDNLTTPPNKALLLDIRNAVPTAGTETKLKCRLIGSRQRDKNKETG